MKTPVIIAAHNEADYIGRCLSSLPEDLVEPIVVTNGCTDDTANIARGFGAEVIEREEQGKLPAIQDALRSLGSRALEPLLLLDADSYPQFPRHWPTAMLRSAHQTEQPVAVAGRVRYVDGSPLIDAYRSLREYYWSYQIRNDQGSPEHILGVNMALSAKREDALDAVLGLPHYWPGEDMAMGQSIIDRGGGVVRPMSLGSIVCASARFHTSFLQRVVRGGDVIHEEVVRRYNDRAAPGSISYDEVRAAQQISQPVA